MRMNRRTVLKGVTLGAGASLMNPMLSQVLAQGADAEAKPKRVVFVVEGNGCDPSKIQPTTIKRFNANGRGNADKFIETALKDQKLPVALEPLDHLKDKMTIIQGLSGRVCGGGHSNNFGALGCYASRAGALDETIDAALAKTLGGIFPHVGVGVAERPEQTIMYNISAWGPQKKLPIQSRPDLAFNNYFGSVAKDAGRKSFDAKTNLLDFMAADIKKLEGSLSGDEKEKLQQHVAAYESMGKRQRDLTKVEEQLRKAAPVVTDKFKSTVETDQLAAQFDIAAGALIGGLTNVVTIASGCGDEHFGLMWDGLGIKIGKHGIGHGGQFEGKNSFELAAIITKFHMELVAGLVKKLEGVKEGDGTMMDNTLIVFLSDGAESHHSRCWEWPLVTIGNLGGSLKLGNRHLQYPKYGAKGHRTMSNFFTTLLNAVGDKRETFGYADVALKDLDQKGGLAELV